MVYIWADPGNWGGGNCIAEYQQVSGMARLRNEYIYADGIDSLVMIYRENANQRLLAVRNQQWSVVALSDLATGNVVERYSYDEFGQRTVLNAAGVATGTISAYDNPYGYTSRRHDNETKLMYFRARFYDPTTGEFTSRDPLEYIDGASMMRGYFGVAGIDPTGMAQFECRCNCTTTRPSRVAHTSVLSKSTTIIDAADLGAASRECNRICNKSESGFGYHKSCKGGIVTDFFRCARNVNEDAAVDASERCKIKTVNCISNHSLLLFAENGVPRIGYSLDGSECEGDLPAPENPDRGGWEEIDVDSCWPCVLVHSQKLGYGSGKGKEVQEASNEDVLDCLKNAPARCDWSPIIYDCHKWTHETAAECGLNCSPDWRR